jgi:uncharacterized phiE125 gp8 family phage protein
MALPTVATLKQYLRIETTAEDLLLARLLEGAQAAVEQYLRRPIAAEVREFFDVPEVWDYSTQTSTVYLPVYPASGVALVDYNETAVASSGYRLEGRSGRVIATGSSRLSSGPYTVTATVGLATDPRYATVIEPVLSRAILDIASDWYHRRNPNAASESTAGVSHSYADNGIPTRTQMVLAPWRQPLTF